MSSELYAIVEEPGTDSERVIATFADYMRAIRFLQSRYTNHEREEGFVDVMLQREDGTLTTLRPWCYPV